MDIYGQIANKIKQIAGSSRLIRSHIFTAQVLKVDGRTCTIKVGDLELTDVRLQAVINDEEGQFYIKPKEKSYVLVADLSNGEFTQLVVISYSQIEEIDVLIEETSFNITKDGIAITVGENISIKADNEKIILNEGENEGLLNINSLTEKLNELKDVVNDLVTNYNSHIHVTTATVGTGAVGVLQPTESKVQKASEFDKAHYEDTKIAH